MNIQLINSPIEHNYDISLRTGIYPPLNLATLAGYLMFHSHDTKIDILDGEMLNWEILLMKINAPIVGINCNLMTYRSALEIAEYAHNKGSKVIMGGPFATSMPERILQNRPFVNAVVYGDGEQALLDYVSGKPYEYIPNLVYLKDGRIKHNPVKRTDMSALPLPDYSTLNMKEYFANYKLRYGEHKPFDGSLAISSIKGCSWRDVSGDGCIFCMIPNKGIQYCNTERVWKEIVYFHELYGVNYFWDVSDSFIDNNNWLVDFAKAKPKHINPGFEIYGRANKINEKKAELLKDIGVFEVFIGAESGDEQILRNINKPITKELVVRAVEALQKNDIRVTISFVIGLPGETHKTLTKTLQFAEELAKYNNVIETSTSVMMPIPGSRAFHELMKIPGIRKKYTTDLFDLEELRNDWIRNFTSLTYKELEKATNGITDMFVLNSNFAQPKHKYISSPCC